MKDLNFDGKITISDYSIYIFGPYNRLLELMANSKVGVFLELSNDDILAHLLSISLIISAVGGSIFLVFFAFAFLIAALQFLITFIRNIPEYLRRLPKEFTSFKLKNVLFQVTFINILFWTVLIVYANFFKKIYLISDDTAEIIGLIGVVLVPLNIYLFIAHNDSKS